MCKICHGFSMLYIEKNLFNELKYSKIHMFKCISESSQISGLALIHKVLLLLLLRWWWYLKFLNSDFSQYLNHKRLIKAVLYFAIAWEY